MKRIYSWFFRQLPVSRVNVDDRLYLLNEDEIKAIRIRERIAIWISAVIGGSGVLFLYIPYYLFPGSFPSIKIVALGKTVELPVLFLTYSVFLVGVELFILTMLNIWCVHEVAVATGFLDNKSKRIPEKRNLLLDIGLEKKNRQVLTYGIDPLHGLNRSALVFWNLMFMLKATLTNMFSRFLIQRVMGTPRPRRKPASSSSLIPGGIGARDAYITVGSAPITTLTGIRRPARR